MTQAGDVLAAIVLRIHPGNPPRQVVPVDLIKHVRVTGRAGSRGLFDEVSRPSAFGQTGHRADIAEWPTLDPNRTSTSM
jgi:hypothetical protein